MKFLERFWFGCGHCHDGAGCHVAEAFERQEFEKGPLRGGPPLVGTVLLVFILPLLTAIGAAYVIDGYLTTPSSVIRGWIEFGGGAAGFFVGVGLARFVLWLCRQMTPASGGAE